MRLVDGVATLRDERASSSREAATKARALFESFHAEANPVPPAAPADVRSRTGEPVPAGTSFSRHPLVTYSQPATRLASRSVQRR